MTAFTRRTVLTGAAATTAVTAVGSVNATLPANAADTATPMKTVRWPIVGSNRNCRKEAGAG